MSEIVTDLGLLEIGDGRNPFEELASAIERLSLENKMKFNKIEFEKTILFLERKYQDYTEIDSNKSKVIIEAINATLFLFQSNEPSTVSDIDESLHIIREMSKHLDSVVDDDSSVLSMGQIIRSLNPNISELNYSVIQGAFGSMKKRINYISSRKESWEIELNFNQLNEDEYHIPLEFIHLFIESLNIIDGVKVTLQEIKTSSIKARLNVEFEDDDSKKQFMEVLDDVKQNIEERLSTEEKSIATEKDVELPNDHLRSNKSIESKEIHKLQTESLKHDVERKKLENEMLRVELFKKKKQVLREMLTEGLIDQKCFEIILKGIPFMKYEDGNLTIGDSLDIIDDL